MNNGQDFSLKNFFIPLTTTKAVHFIVIIGFVVYAHALFNSFVFDDLPQIVNYPLLHSLANLPGILTDHSLSFYRPLPAIVFAGLYTLFGPTPFWFHLFQIALHIGVSLLLFFLFKAYFNTLRSLLLSLLFLVHPINVEAVAYISALQTVMSLFFGLAGLLVIMRRHMRAVHRYSLLALLLLFSALSKETGVLLLILFPLFMFVNAKKTYDKKEYVLCSIAILCMLLVYLPLQFTTTGLLSSSPLQGVSPVPIRNAPLLIHLLSLPKILFFYVFTFIYPKDLLISQQWLVRTATLQNFYFPLFVDLLFFLVLLFAEWRIWYTNRKHFALSLFFCVWFFLGWAVHWNIIPLDMTVADHWYYFALPGLLGILGTTLPTFSFVRHSVSLLLFLIIMGLLGLSLRTIVRTADWKDELTLYSHDLMLNHDSYQLENQLANTLLLQQQYEQARPHIFRSLALAPTFWENWNNLGVYYESKKDIGLSLHAFSTAIKYNPQYRMGYINLANSAYHYKSPKEAAPFIVTGLKKYPNDPFFLSLKGVTDYRLGNKQQARNEIQEAYTSTHSQELFNTYYLMQENKPLE